MSSAKRTPRYVDVIPPRNLQIVGKTAEAQVIPIRRITPAYTPVIDAPLPAPTRKRAKAPVVPVAKRPWLLLLVPPTPGARTRSYNVARWQARVIIGSLCLLLMLAGAAVAALVAAVRTPDLFATSADAAALRAQLLDMQDSLSMVRDELAEGVAPADAATPATSFFAPTAKPLADGSSPAPASPAPAARVAARKPAAPRAARSSARAGSADAVALAPRSVEGLPVIGRLASGFSRSRRHPILKVRRPHLGVDVAAPRGTPITAPAAGTIAFVGRRFGYGLVVEIKHGNGILTRYAHLRSASVEAGQEVAFGALIAAVGSSGISTGPHLHYEVLVHGRQVDPLRFRIPKGTAAPPESTVTTTPSAPTATGSSSPIVVPQPTLSHETIAPLQIAPAPR